MNYIIIAGKLAKLCIWECCTAIVLPTCIYKRIALWTILQTDSWSWSAQGRHHCHDPDVDTHLRYCRLQDIQAKPFCDLT